MDTSRRVEIHRLTSGRPAFVDRPRRHRTIYRRTLASVDLSPSFDGVMHDRARQSAAKDLTARSPGSRAKIDAKAQADRDLERARNVLDATLNDASATMADADRWKAEVRQAGCRRRPKRTTAAKGISAREHRDPSERPRRPDRHAPGTDRRRRAQPTSNVRLPIGRRWDR